MSQRHALWPLADALQEERSLWRFVVDPESYLGRWAFSGSYGIAQVLELGVDAHLSSGRLVILFPDWDEELFPLYAYYPSRQYLAPKSRAFLEFLIYDGTGLALAQNKAG
jgi:DNA-binding transcriptional LysR family regulator